ncbi:hypothetical protein V6Z12_D01G122400 [Gossypium hirsutum]
MASSNTPIPVDDGFNEYESALKRQKSITSKVWDEMTKLECENKNELKAQCNHCKTIFFAKSSSRTSHLRRHLNSCLNKFDADECRQAISTFLVCGKHSFRTVEEPGFRYMMKIASLNFKNIKRDRVKEELAKTPGLICLTFDNWNSEHTNYEYICITAHWVDKDWKLQKRIIRFTALFPPYNGLNIADKLVLCLSQWGIDKKIFSITLDNASYNDVIVSCLKNHFHENRAILCDDAFFQVRCCAHTLNLIVKAGLELADDVVNVLGYWGQWDKDYQMFALFNEEWRNVAILCKFLKVFYDVTWVWKVHKVLLDTVKGLYSFLTPMVKQMQEKFNKYWAGYSLILSCAAILDPRYKLNYVQYCFNTIYGIHASDFVETILRNLRLLFDEYVKKSKPTSSSLVGSSNVLDKNPDDSSLDEHNVNSVDVGGDFDESDDYKRYLNESSTRSEKSHLDIYLEEPELELNSQIDVLDYWSKSSVRYNELSLLVRDLLAIPISAVAFESAFSMGKKVITPLGSSFKQKTVQAVICLDDWMRAKGFSIGLDDWMRAKGFSTKIGYKNDDDDEDDEDDISSIAF